MGNYFLDTQYDGHTDRQMFENRKNKFIIKRTVHIKKEKERLCVLPSYDKNAVYNEHSSYNNEISGEKRRTL